MLKNTQRDTISFFLFIYLGCGLKYRTQEWTENKQTSCLFREANAVLIRQALGFPGLYLLK